MLLGPVEQPTVVAPPLLLVVGSNHQFLANQLAVIARQMRHSLVILIPTDEANYSNTLRHQILYSLKQARFKVGYYQSYWHCVPAAIIEISSSQIMDYAHQLQQCGSYFLNLQSFTVDENQTADFSCSSVITTILEQLDQWGLEMNTDLLSEAMECFDANLALGGWADIWAEVANCATRFTHLGPKDTLIWEGEAGAYYRFVQDLDAWTHPELHGQQALLKPLMTEAQIQTQNWPLQAALLLYKRFCSDTHRVLPIAPEWFQTMFTHYRTRNQRYLEILPTVEDDTVTILIVTFNRLALLQRAVNSVLAQTYTRWKLIIGDGGSTDGTQAYGETLAAGDPRITYMWWDLPPGREGFHETQRRLFALPETEWVVAVPDDDWLAPDHLAKSMAMSQKYPWVAMVFGSFSLMNETGVVNDYTISKESGPLDLVQALRLCPLPGLCPQGCLHRLSFIKQMVYPLLSHADQTGETIAWDYILAMDLLAHFECAYVPDIIFYVNSTTNSAFSGAHTDFSLTYMRVYHDINQACLELFRAPYPPELKQLYIDNLLQPTIIKTFKQFLRTNPTRAEFDAYIQLKKDIWFDFCQLFD